MLAHGTRAGIRGGRRPGHWRPYKKNAGWCSSPCLTKIVASLDALGDVLQAGHAVVAVACSFAIGSAVRSVTSALAVAIALECCAAYVAEVGMGWMIVVAAVASLAGRVGQWPSAGSATHVNAAAATSAAVIVADLVLCGISTTTTAGGVPSGLLASVSVMCTAFLVCFAVVGSAVVPAFLGASAALVAGTAFLSGFSGAPTPACVAISTLAAASCSGMAVRLL
jgi:hypothetical protein